MLQLLSLLPGVFNTVNKITDAIANERLKLIDAKTDQDRISAQERISTLQARRDVLVAESGSSRINAFIRASIGASAAVIIGKLLVWDKTIGSLAGCYGNAGRGANCAMFNTDPLDVNQWYVITAAVGFYFLCETFRKR